MIQRNLEKSNDDQGRVYQICKFYDPAGAWPYSEYAMFLLLFLSTLGHELEKLSIYM